jgi:hypothetical protein
MANFDTTVISISITQAAAGITRASFGNGAAITQNPYVPGTLSGKPRFGLYGPDDIITNFGALCPEYYAATKYFGQMLTPSQILLAAKKMDSASVHINKGRVGHVYKVSFRDDSATPKSVDVSYTSPSADKATIAAAIAALITAQITEATWTAEVDGEDATSIIVTYNGSGEWWFVFQNDDEYISVDSFDSSADMATMLADLRKASALWYHFGLIYRDETDQAAAIIFANVATNVAYFHAATSNDDIKENNDDNPAQLSREASYSRSEYFWDSRVVMIDDIDDYPVYGSELLWYQVDQFPEFAWMGRMMPIDPDVSAATWDLKNLVGLTADPEIDTTVYAALKENHVNCYIEKYGIGCTDQGRASNDSPIDVTTTVDWTRARIGEAIFARLVNAEKIPMTDAGIDLISAQIEAHFKRGMTQVSPPHFNFNVALGPFGYHVGAPLAADITSADRLARELKGVVGQVQLAGAIEKVYLSINIVP